MNFSHAIRNILHEIVRSPDLQQTSRESVHQWLSVGHEWVLIQEFERLLQIAQEAGISHSKFLTHLSLDMEEIQIPETS